jgi:LmbE family N-acetylglucosaminyl deacetylase
MLANRPMRGLRLWLLLLTFTLPLAGCASSTPGDLPAGEPNPKAPVPAKERPQLELKPDDRIMILAPHPDDETLSSGGLIQQALDMGLPVRVVFLTNGDNDEFSYALYRGSISLDPTEVLLSGLTRHQEALNATATLGLKPDQVTFLGYPDFGTLEIWRDRWGDREPLRAMMTQRNAVPYTDTLSPGAPYKGESILTDLTRVLRDFKPTKVVVSHPGDHNPDHQALYLFLRTALWDLANEISPKVYSYLVHYGRFPSPRGLRTDAPLEPPASFDIVDVWRVLPLTDGQISRKLAALKQHRTQFDAASKYLEAFVRRNELFADLTDEIKLTPGTPVITGQSVGKRRPMEQLTAGELQEYTETETRSIRLEGNDLVFSIAFSAPLEGDVKATASFYGYRSDRPFAEMPKLQVVFDRTGYKVLERGQQVRESALQVKANATSAEIRIPLAFLGDPEHLLFSSRVQTGEVPLSVEPWLALDLVVR